MMDKRELIKKYEKLFEMEEVRMEDTKVANSKYNMLKNILRELKRMDSEITTEQAWEKIAEDKGCTIEKEPVWVVKIKEKLYFCRFTDKYFKENSDEPTYSESGNPKLVKKFTDKAKAEAVATLINGKVEEWSE